MPSVSLSKALKIKNRLAHELSLLETAMRTNNARRVDRVTPDSPADALALLPEYHGVQARMTELKTKISAANTGAGHDLEMLTQLKAELALIRSLPCRDEVEVVAYGEQVREYTWRSAIPEVRRTEMERALQKRINDLQDRIDDFNAVSLIELSFE